MAARRNRKNGRFTKTSRRRSKPKLNLIDTTTSLVVANALTEGLVRAKLMDFFTGRKDGSYRAGTDGSFRITLPELLKGPNIMSHHGGGTVTGVLRENLKANGTQMVTTMVVAPMIARLVKKSLRKPLLTPMNRILSQTGLNVKV